MKSGPNVSAHVRDIRIDQTNERPHHLTRRDAEELIFLRRLSNNRSRIDGVSSPRDSLNPKLGELRCFGVMAEVISKWPFDPPLLRRHHTFENDFRPRRHK